MDEFIEVWQGNYGRIVFSEKEEDVSRELKVYQLNENEWYQLVIITALSLSYYPGIHHIYFNR